MKKNITIDDLAVMVQKGFNGIANEMATKNEMNRHFNLVDERFDKIEKLILADYKKRIERLESSVRELKEALAIG